MLVLFRLQTTVSATENNEKISTECHNQGSQPTKRNKILSATPISPFGFVLVPQPGLCVFLIFIYCYCNNTVLVTNVQYKHYFGNTFFFSGELCSVARPQFFNKKFVKQSCYRAEQSRTVQIIETTPFPATIF